MLFLPLVIMAQLPVLYLTFDHMDDSDSEVYNVMDGTTGLADGSIVSGQYGSGYALNGTDSYIRFEDPIIEHSSVTITVWYSGLTSQFEENALFQTDGSETDGGAVFVLMYDDSGLECFAGGSTELNELWVDADILEETWMHFAMVIDTEEEMLKIYVDGEEVGSAEASFDAEVDKPLIGPFAIGAHYVDGNVDRNWPGTVDEFRLYDVALTEEEVVASMEELEEVSARALESPGFSIYPNPTNGIFYLSQDLDNVRIYGVTGQELMSIHDYKAGRQINASQLGRGFYFLKAGSQRSESAVKLIIR